jgi:hypothetical protein
VSRYDELLERREAALLELALPILVSHGRSDTASPMFHGCHDWHSCVHGVWALHAIAGRTGEDVLLDAAYQQARTELVEAELDFLRSTPALVEEETPYGFAWLLKLAATREAAGDSGLQPLADYSQALIVEWLSRLDEASARRFALLDRHANLSFALIHLGQWARFRGDDGLLGIAADAARRFLAPVEADADFPLERDTLATDEFMPTSILRLAAIAQLLGDEGCAFVRGRVPAGYAVPPITKPVSNHAGGVNAFRAWFLWDLHEATGDEAIRESYADLVLTQLSLPDLWMRGPNSGYRHWVAQITVRAIERSYESAAAAPHVLD